MEYDLKRLFEHPFRFHQLVPSAIVTFGSEPVGKFAVRVQWKLSAGTAQEEDDLVLRWDMAVLKKAYPPLEEEIANIRERDLDRARRVENSAIIVAIAVMENLVPGTRITQRSSIGTGHDYYLDETVDEMLEVAGRWEAGLPGLFEEKRQQSESNPQLRKRWISVTVFQRNPRNQTEGLHP
jgi:hypothetical protein